jgi:outer membrane protein TolC
LSSKNIISFFPMRNAYAVIFGSLTPRLIFSGFLTIGLMACSTYKPLPLAKGSTLIPASRDLVIDRDRISLPVLAAHIFDPSDGLDATEVAMVAVVNSPAMILARDDAHVGQAQAFAAGLLPDPQLSLSHDFSRSGAPDLTSAFSYGIGYEITALLTHASAVNAARADKHRIDLTLLWQEWQTVAQAKTLFAKLKTEEQELRLLTTLRPHLADYYRHVEAMINRSDLTLDSANQVLTSLQDLNRQISDLDTQTNQTRHALNLLLGLAPDTELKLVGEVDLAEPNAAALSTALADLPNRRPDLLALKAGYNAEDARVRQAILAQFPVITVGLTHARDTSNISNNSFDIGLSIPIFNGNRGNIAIEEATRQRLHDEYSSRLNAALTDIDELMAKQRLTQTALRQAEQAMQPLQNALASAEQALDSHNIDANGYFSLQASVLAKQFELLNLRNALIEQYIALETLIGGQIPQKYNAARRRP